MSLAPSSKHFPLPSSKHFLFLFLFLHLSSFLAHSQLSSGFNKQEYLELLQVSQYQADTFLTRLNLEMPENCERLYRSERKGLENAWEFWRRDDGVGIISIHGTKPNYWSWLENFYSAMVPANGALELANGKLFKYKLAEDSTACVHTGWLVALGFMIDDILLQLEKLSKEGYRDFIIVGHSQGGAIAFLLDSYLHYSDQPMLQGLKFKTYCSAAPKPGNLYYAYDFDKINYGGWAFRVVNREDWVPELPFSIQTLDDLNEVNPFIEADQGFKRMPVLQRIAVRSVYNDMAKSAEKARKTFHKTLGPRVYKLVSDRLVEYKEHEYAPSMSYSTAGCPIILEPGEGYEQFMEEEIETPFIHHTMMAYFLCASGLPE